MPRVHTDIMECRDVSRRVLVDKNTGMQTAA
jgi:hypothetical protein